MRLIQRRNLMEAELMHENVMHMPYMWVSSPSTPCARSSLAPQPECGRIAADAHLETIRCPKTPPQPHPLPFTAALTNQCKAQVYLAIVRAGKLPEYSLARPVCGSRNPFAPRHVSNQSTP